MVALYVRGQKVGTLAEAERLIPQLAAQREVVEFRDESGKRIGQFTPDSQPLCPWEPDLTREEIDRRCTRTGKPLSEILKRLGAE
jgi:hypothetical protein